MQFAKIVHLRCWEDCELAVRGSASRLLMKSMFLIEWRHLCIFCALSEGTVVAAPQLAGGQSLQVLRVDGPLTCLEENTISISTSISILVLKQVISIN